MPIASTGAGDSAPATPVSGFIADEILFLARRSAGRRVTVHLPNGFFWTAGGIEYPLMWGLVAVAVFLRGGDRYSLDARLRLPI